MFNDGNKTPETKRRTVESPLTNTTVHTVCACRDVPRNIIGFLTSFVKNGEIRLSLSYKIILEQREESNRLNSWKEQLVICSRAFWKQKCENLKNVGLIFFKFQSILTYSVSGQRH